MRSVRSRSGSGRRMAWAEPRRALAARKPLRPHLAEPAALDAAAARTESGAPDQDAGLVMLCVRVPPSLRRRARLTAIANGLTMQQLAVEGAGGGMPATRRESTHVS